MALRAVKTFAYGARTYNPGDVFDTTEGNADELVKRGFCVQHGGGGKNIPYNDPMTSGIKSEIVSEQNVSSSGVTSANIIKRKHLGQVRVDKNGDIHPALDNTLGRNAPALPEDKDGDGLPDDDIANSVIVDDDAVPRIKKRNK